MKNQLDSRICSSLRKRIVFHSTRYRGTHDQVGKAWITFDNEMIQDFYTINRKYKRNTLASELRKQSHSTNDSEPAQRENYYRASRFADKEMVRQGIHSQHEFYNAVEEYLNLSTNEALTSTNPIIRALSILDRRLGKRRLISIRDDHPIVNKLLIIRLLVEYFDLQEINLS
ncbi:hypothetical protein [Paenibacillus sp. LHD-38]|uniref:SF0329 family protein n=1 Tax=Paenibacillus sp. LHD-38 TaxID=3072143 RepID=UPI00280CF8AC|nr:hypothetical protein [Paenibacillus sp. LHD-38]MDQ8736399.1 hypothetical protein [Paenibacillus sp. LHD-38]